MEEGGGEAVLSDMPDLAATRRDVLVEGGMRKEDRAARPLFHGGGGVAAPRWRTSFGSRVMTEDGSSGAEEGG